jgi:tungstate transport system ATP-binding protein
VRVVRAGREILTIPELHVRQQRTTAILGSNGAGKTTLLRLIAGLEHPDEGRVLVGGLVADSRRRAVGYVFQEAVFLRRSLLDNVALGLDIRGVPHADARERARHALRLLGIEHLADRRADRISGGEARRASLARTLCLGAPVLLLDEPMAGLDNTTAARLLEELPGLLSAAGATTLLVTHDRDEALRLADDLVVLQQGQVIAAGEKRAIVTNPAHADAAAALGYAVVTIDGRRVAIPEGELQLAAGPRGMPATVEAVFDLVREWDVVAAIEGVRIHVRVPRSEAPPLRGDRILVAARVMYDVS